MCGGQLSQEQLRQLLLVAVQCSTKKELGNSGLRVAECRPCHLVMVKLLPSVREKQQVVRVLIRVAE